MFTKMCLDRFAFGATTVAVRRHGSLPALALLALASVARANVSFDNEIEAESGSITNGAITESDTASGGALVKLGEGGSLEFEVEVTEGVRSLIVKFSSPEATRLVDVTINGIDVGVLICRESIDGAWDTVALAHPFPGPGFYLVGLHTSSDSQGGLLIDTMATCETPAGQSCGGCSAAPLAPPTVFNNKVGLVMPPLPGIAGVIGGIAKKLKMSTITIFGPIVTTPGDGECELKPKDAEKPCGDTECVEKTGCNVKLTVQFYVNDYARPPFWDSTEEVVFPNGKKKSYRRFGSPLETYSDTTSGKCGKGSNVVLQFENGSITQPLSCNACQ